MLPPDSKLDGGELDEDDEGEGEMFDGEDDVAAADGEEGEIADAGRAGSGNAAGSGEVPSGSGDATAGSLELAAGSGNTATGSGDVPAGSDEVVTKGAKVGNMKGDETTIALQAESTGAALAGDALPDAALLPDTVADQ